ncbi:signal transduction histidine kinase, partial [Lasius niger]
MRELTTPMGHRRRYGVSWEGMQRWTDKFTVLNALQGLTVCLATCDMWLDELLADIYMDNGLCAGTDSKGLPVVSRVSGLFSVPSPLPGVDPAVGPRPPALLVDDVRLGADDAGEDEQESGGELHVVDQR